MNSAKVSTVVQCKNILGESCFWDPRDKCIWWTDIEGKKVWKLDDKNQSFEFNLPDRAGFILPRKKDGFIISYILIPEDLNPITSFSDDSFP